MQLKHISQRNYESSEGATRTRSYKQNSSAEFDSTLALTNQVSHMTNFSFSAWSIFLCRVKFYARTFSRIGSIFLNKIFYCQSAFIVNQPSSQQSRSFFLLDCKCPKSVLTLSRSCLHEWGSANTNTNTFWINPQRQQFWSARCWIELRS